MSAPSASRTSPTRRAPDAGGVVLGVFAAVAVAFVVVPLVGAAVTAALPAALAKRFALGASLVTLILGIAAAAAGAAPEISRTQTKPASPSRSSSPQRRSCSVVSTGTDGCATGS